MRAVAAGGCMRGRRVSRERCTSCSWLHSLMLRCCPELLGPPTCLISGPAHPHIPHVSLGLLVGSTAPFRAPNGMGFACCFYTTCMSTGLLHLAEQVTLATKHSVGRGSDR